MKTGTRCRVRQGRSRGLVAGQVVENDNLAFAQRRHQLGFSVEEEHPSVHRTIDDPWGIQPVVAQRTDKGLGAPVSEGRVINQALPARCPTFWTDCRSRWLGMKARRFVIQMHRRSATSLRLCSSA